MKKISFASALISIFLLFNSLTSTAQPGIIATYAGKESGPITVKEFLSDSTIHVLEKNDASIKYEVVSFKISVIRRGDYDPLLDIPSNGNKMPEKMKKLIEDLDVGNKFYFEEIKAKCISCKDINGNPDNAIRRVEALSFTIVDK